MKPTPAATAASTVALWPSTRRPISLPLISSTRSPPANASGDAASQSYARTSAPGTSSASGVRVSRISCAGSTVFSSSAVTSRPSWPDAPVMTRLIRAVSYQSQGGLTAAREPDAHEEAHDCWSDHHRRRRRRDRPVRRHGRDRRVLERRRPRRADRLQGRLGQGLRARQGAQPLGGDVRRRHAEARVPQRQQGHQDHARRPREHRQPGEDHAHRRPARRRPARRQHDPDRRRHRQRGRHPRVADRLRQRHRRGRRRPHRQGPARRPRTTKTLAGDSPCRAPSRCARLRASAAGTPRRPPPRWSRGRSRSPTPGPAAAHG